ncbi:MAG: DUF2975 domain-containing protein [Bavariicoccus seileri]|uniref:DUF2975 domain-containing protein n=1 Tax=Bavariicoccus seileri TaxID=549685 RepID=UPI0003B5C138|nr:DUF2975 domain-containing protein [Bavariicoccus seileri]
MKKDHLSNSLRIVLILLGIATLIIYAVLIPQFGREIVATNPEFSYYYLPWLLVIWSTVIPLVISLVIALKVVNTFQRNGLELSKTAGWIKQIALLIGGDATYFFVMNLLFLVIGMNHPGVIVLATFILLIGLTVTLVFLFLSRLLQARVAHL